MKKFYRIFLLLIILTFLSTYNPVKLNLISNKKNDFFDIKNITVENNFLIKKNSIKKKLHKIYNKNIFLIKRNDVEGFLQDIDFLEKIEVKKKYPNTLVVKIFETKPIAILFKDKTKYLLDSSANIISYTEEMSFNDLPSIFGDNAENYFLNFLNQIKSNNFPEEKIKNFYYFQIGRWDLQLLNNKTIKFPYENTEEAIKKSIELLSHKDFENYNIIDLRVDGKIIVE